jgi:hypothetical protein
MGRALLDLSSRILSATKDHKRAGFGASLTVHVIGAILLMVALMLGAG